MNVLHVPTLFLMIAMISSVCTVIMLVLWRINHSMSGVFHWFLATAASATAFLLMFPVVGRGGAEEYFLVVNNTLTLTAVTLTVEGSLRFRGFQSDHRWKWMLALVPLFALLAWVNRDDVVHRYLWHDSLTATGLLAVAVVMVWRTGRDEFRIYQLSALFAALLALALLFRWWTSLQVLLDPARELAAATVLVFVAMSLYLMGWTFSITVACYFREHQHTLLLASEDVLTGLPNRRSIDETLNRTLERARRHREHFAVVMLDLNRFKRVNDELGHQAGDALLVEVARRLRCFLREADYAGRLGGDEFLLIVHGIDNRVSAGRVAKRLREALDGPAVLGSETVSVAIAVGVAIWPQDGDSVDALLTAADRHMYEDKPGHS
ncbi:GGDEF domain-containing protein [Haliea sp. E1-2-M8]|uniref:GGDEF domain-containing protein n=1 Tax=Haliea sp. E1-2-M8 TaxID=3064706 RepID=UPI00271B4407|nr:GGDEF domain-containing protein [Haliea sp. E1-2-M8]MDO8863091.1 GGDEF domain-containing protein [Haliea sp. E1-2-M8]